jgi:hypothetical protein
MQEINIEVDTKTGKAEQDRLFSETLTQEGLKQEIVHTGTLRLMVVSESGGKPQLNEEEVTRIERAYEHQKLEGKSTAIECFKISIATVKENEFDGCMATNKTDNNIVLGSYHCTSFVLGADHVLAVDWVMSDSFIKQTQNIDAVLFWGKDLNELALVLEKVYGGKWARLNKRYMDLLYNVSKGAITEEPADYGEVVKNKFTPETPE